MMCIYLQQQKCFDSTQYEFSTDDIITLIIKQSRFKNIYIKSADLPLIVNNNKKWHTH